MATWAIVTGTCLCYAMGLAGYLSFRDSVDGDILLNFSGAVASVFKLAVVFHLVLYIPSEVRPDATWRMGDEVVVVVVVVVWCCCCCCGCCGWRGLPGEWTVG